MNSITQLNNIIDDLQQSGKTVTVKKLRTRGPRKGETWSKSPAGMVSGRALGNVKSATDSTTKATVAGGGREQTMTPTCGIGKEMVRNLGKVQDAYRKQIAADRRQAAQDRMAEKIDAALAI